MPNIIINPDLCTRCGNCVVTCPETIFAQAEKGALPVTVHEEICISCGHCVAICPENAIAHPDFPEGSVHPLTPELIPSAEQVLEMLRARRSLRLFKDQPVGKELVARLIDAACLAPSAHNTQSTEYLVIQDAALLKRLAELTAQYYGKTARQLRNPVIRPLYRLIAGRKIEGALHLLQDLDMVAEAARNGQDLILRGAPCLIVCHAKPSVNYPEANAILAIHNATLMAQALGLGAFQVGYLVGACARDKRLRELLGIPRQHRVYGALAVGRPRLTFKKWMQRRPAKVRWVP